MVRKGYIPVAWLFSLFANQEKHCGSTIAFQQPQYITRRIGRLDRTSGPSQFHVQTLGISKSRNPENTTSTSRPRFTTKNLTAKSTRRRKLNSDIYWLRNQKSGIRQAEKRLEEAIADMIEQKNQVEGDDIPSLLQKYQQQKQENKKCAVSDEKLDQWPDVVSFHGVMISHAKNTYHDPLAAKRAIGLLERMKELSAVFPHLSPNIFSYNTVLEAYCIHNRQNIVGHHEQLLENRGVILRVYEELQEIGLSPNTYTRNLILASSISKDSEEWIRLEDWACSYLDGNDDGIIPDRKTYNTLFKLYSSIGDAKGAEKMLRKLLKWHASQENDEERLKPSKYIFDCVFKALAASDPNCDMLYLRLRQVMAEMKDLVKSGRTDLQPDTLTYNHILNIYAKHGDPELAVILMKEREASSNEADALDHISYTTVIRSFATAQKKLAASEIEKSLEMAEKATEILERMRKKSIRPSIVTCKCDHFCALYFI